VVAAAHRFSTSDNGPPGVRQQYSSDDAGLYSDGDNVEAVAREF